MFGWIDQQFRSKREPCVRDAAAFRPGRVTAGAGSGRCDPQVCAPLRLGSRALMINLGDQGWRLGMVGTWRLGRSSAWGGASTGQSWALGAWGQGGPACAASGCGLVPPRLVLSLGGRPRSAPGSYSAWARLGNAGCARRKGLVGLGQGDHAHWRLDGRVSVPARPFGVDVNPMLFVVDRRSEAKSTVQADLAISLLDPGQPPRIGEIYAAPVT